MCACRSTYSQILSIFAIFFFVFAAYKLNGVDRRSIFRTQQAFRIVDRSIDQRERNSCAICHDIRLAFACYSANSHTCFCNQLAILIYITEAFQQEFILVIFYFRTIVQQVDAETSVAYIYLSFNISLIFIDIFHIVHRRSRNDREFIAETCILIHFVDALIFSRIYSQESTSLKFFVSRNLISNYCLRIRYCQISTSWDHVYHSVPHILFNFRYFKCLELLCFGNHIGLVIFDLVERQTKTFTCNCFIHLCKISRLLCVFTKIDSTFIYSQTPQLYIPIAIIKKQGIRRTTHSNSIPIYAIYHLI